MTSLTNRGIPLSLINPRFLHSNSTSHTWPFSAVAGLIDNAYDVSAKQLWIEKRVFKHTDCLIFLDNGQGMDYDKMHKMLSFGFSDKSVKGHAPVGLYGNGFKSGSMRLGKDAIVFSKQADPMCVGLLSQTYLERTGAQNVVVPIVMLSNSSGTRIIIWNLRTKSSGELEFDFMKDPKDIRILDDVYKTFREPNKHQGQESKSVPESDYSLRAYCSILYLNPRMEIILQGQKVETQSITTTLAKARTDTYKPDCVKKGLTITFGYNKKSMEHYGLMMYHQNRLIKAYVRVPCQRKNNNTGQGVIGVIECNHLKPTHNKQDFDDTQEYRNTMKNLNKKLEQYWRAVSYSYQAFKPAENTDERAEKLQQDKREQIPVIPRPSMPVTPRPSDDTSVFIPDKTLSTTPKRKEKALDPSQEKPKKKTRIKDFPAIISPVSEPNTADCKDFKTALKDNSAVTDLCMMREESSKITKSGFEDQQNIKVLYLQAMDTMRQLQDKLRELKQVLKTEEVDKKMDSLQYEKWTNCCESLQKDLEEIKIESEKVKVTDEDFMECEGKGNRTISTQHSNTKYHTEATDVFTPELLQHCADSGAYRFLCSHAGVFPCKLTNISFDMKRSGEVLYTVESWDNSQLQGMGQFKPAGPLYNIDCSEDSILYLHLPHCEIHTDKNKLELAVAHFSEDNVEIIQPLNITSTHVIFEVHGLSIFGLLKKWIFSENPISAQVLLFYKEIIGNERRRKLHIHLLPGNVPVDKVQEQHQCNTYIQCSSICTLTPGKKYRPHCEPYVSQPKVERFGCDFGPNYHPTFEVILNAEVENLTLGLLDETDQEVWEPRQVFLTDESREAVPVEMNEGAAFVDKHRDTLIQRDLPVLEIADTLLTKKLITHEMYNEMIEARTPQNKMRILYRHLNSRAVTAEFYKILKEKQPDVVDELNPR
ncbi:uncharacterized protein LOC131354217 [Hemibagrus wyckioides]|uniref:uncharacterized protein LOC131354217 n=1 Tax=Hemibagrus wyckioides TaxID=337641 RepID=UPI00266BB6EE|nr:uncharacterized protein LOC131354217 [Hemibagrus wyckioides]